MANFITWARVTGGSNGSAPDLFVASTNDNLAAITTSGYVAAEVAAEKLKVNDYLYINYDVDGTEDSSQFIVTSTGSGSLVEVEADQGYLLAANNLDDVASNLTAIDNLGFRSGTTAAYGGGGTSNAYTATGLLATDNCVAMMKSSTNVVAWSAANTDNTLTVTFASDPGANTVFEWIAIPTV